MTAILDKTCGFIVPHLKKAKSLPEGEYFNIAKQVALLIPSVFLLTKHPIVTVLSAAAGLGLRVCSLAGKDGEKLIESIKKLWGNQSFQIFTLIGLIAISCVLPTLSLTILTMANGFNGTDRFLDKKDDSETEDVEPGVVVKSTSNDDSSATSNKGTDSPSTTTTVKTPPVPPPTTRPIVKDLVDSIEGGLG